MKPLLPADSVPPKWSTWCATVMKSTGITDMDYLKQVYEDEFIKGETWMNDLYVVIKKDLEEGVVHLSIRRTDRAACRDWRHFQQIKNQLCGPEREAVEIYPAESRVMDTANQFHLWVLAEGQHVPLGYFLGRHVNGSEDAKRIPGSVQRDID